MISSYYFYQLKRKSSLIFVKKFYKELETIQKGDIIDPWKPHALEKLLNELSNLISSFGEIMFKASGMRDEIRYGNNLKRLDAIKNDIIDMNKRADILEKQLKVDKKMVKKLDNILKTKKNSPGLSLVKKHSQNKE